MFLAQYLFKGPTAYTVYSPWMRRSGDNAVFSVDVIAISASTTLSVTVHTKKDDAAGDGGTGIATITQSVTGRGSVECIGQMEDLVRYKFAVTGSNPTDFVLFRMLEAKWFDTVKAS